MKEELLKIINNYGINHQLRKFNEETYELIEAIIKYEEAKYDYFEKYICHENRDISTNNIAEEIADVTVMLKQFQYYYGIEDKEIEEVMKYKVERQLERINRGE